MTKRIAKAAIRGVVLGGVGLLILLVAANAIHALGLDQVVSQWTPAIVSVEVVLVFLAIAFRLFDSSATQGITATPLLLRRDFLLFLPLMVLVLGQQYARTTGVRLGDFQWWVIGTDLLELFCISFYLAIEYGVIGRRKDVA